MGRRVYIEKQELKEQVNALEADMAVLDDNLLELVNEGKEHEKSLFGKMI